jgi:cytoskeletal protein RodZ
MFAKFKKKSIPIDPQQAQQEKLAEIGAYLAQIRTEKAMSLKLIEAKTQIAVRLLRAIEKGELNSLPEPVYIRGLIKQFADTLGLDGTELANMFPIDVKIRSGNAFSSLRLPSWQLRPFHLYFLYIVLVIFSVRGISNILRQSVPEIAIETQSQPIVQPSPASQTQSKASKPTTTPPKKNPTKPVVVDIKVNDLSWIEIIADGKSVFQGNLPKGTQRTWTAEQQLIVRTGNAGGVLVKFNDEQPKPLGKLGQVESVTYQAKPAEASHQQQRTNS